MIARIWRGAVRTEDAEDYIAYIEETGIREYRETPGNISAHMLRRDLALWVGVGTDSRDEGARSDHAGLKKWRRGRGAGRDHIAFARRDADILDDLGIQGSLILDQGSEAVCAADIRIP